MLNAILLAASITIPVAEVSEIADYKTRTYPGRVVPIAQVNVVPQVSGEILEVGFENGTRIKEGQLLYRLDSVKYEAAVKNAEAKVGSVRRTSPTPNSPTRDTRSCSNPVPSRSTRSITRSRSATRRARLTPPRRPS